MELLSWLFLHFFPGKHDPVIGLLVPTHHFCASLLSLVLHFHPSSTELSRSPLLPSRKKVHHQIQFQSNALIVRQMNDLRSAPSKAGLMHLSPRIHPGYRVARYLHLRQPLQWPRKKILKHRFHLPPLKVAGQNPRRSDSRLGTLPPQSSHVPRLRNHEARHDRLRSEHLQTQLREGCLQRILLLCHESNPTGINPLYLCGSKHDLRTCRTNQSLQQKY
mmetsp:Transcript_9252/g.17335  ORF Transcript_9252/g.17335 Transcript_9252/m.17335 type:complete len:219 (+) Transcript_9252:402-1058(+)